jgi:uncharacterized YceG family protein
MKNILIAISLFSICLIVSCRENPVAIQSQQLSFNVMRGERFRDFCKRIEIANNTNCNAFKSVAENESFDNYIFVPDEKNITRFEGLFRPGKYSMNLNQSETCMDINPSVESDCFRKKYEVAKAIVMHLLQKSSDRFVGKSPEIFLQEITLASIIEKEAASHKNYNIVSSVFHNRMNQNMNLGSCPTVEYALGYHRPFLLNKDIAIQSPYNVYKRKGLPPSPISFFSDEALHASRNPAKTEYLFFVYDWTTGELHFSEKYEQHKNYAKIAKENFIKKFGKEAIHKVYTDKFYEL